MKKLISILILLVIITSCAPTRPVLNGNRDKYQKDLKKYYEKKQKKQDKVWRFK